MNLAGADEPIVDIDQPYDPDWWLRKLIKRERLSVVPRAVEIRSQVERALEEARGSRDERMLRSRLDDLNARIARWNATTLSGPATTVSRVDVEAAVRAVAVASRAVMRAQLPPAQV